MRDLFTGHAPIGGAASPSDELIVDCFAGGGGASEGIFLALGRHPDFAVNHDALALAMHRRNHPETVHVSKNINKVDPMDLCHNRPVGLLWASPDCKTFSKAKGGRPVKRNIRDLAWTVVTWAKRARPRVIILENVEEFQAWGPLVLNEKGEWVPCKNRLGQTFKKWVSELRRCGYKVEWRELRACDYGAPTIRKRLFVIARRDGAPIVWPRPTHAPLHAANDNVIEKWLKEHKLKRPDLKDMKPWVAAHTIIDWSLPCPSIFDTKEEIWEKFGLKVKRPLVPATMKRIARGVFRYVLGATKPFLVVCNHGGDWFRGQGLDEPMPTLTASRDAFGVVSPIFSYAQQGGGNRSPEEPHHTITASQKDQNTLVSAYLKRDFGQSVGQDVHQPAPTVMTNGEGKTSVVSAFLAKHNRGATGSSLHEPAPTITANGASKRQGCGIPTALVAAQMVSLGGNDRREYGPNEPVRTLSAGGTHEAVVATYLDRQFSRSTGASAEAPCPTITAGGDGKTNVVAAFLNTYYGCSETHSLDDPMGADTTRDRRSLVTVSIDGQSYVLEDIGMRMLTPRERFRAQGFRDSYEIEVGIGEDGEEVNLTQTAQGRMCGNSVCPPMAEALVSANCGDLRVVEAAHAA